MKSARILPLFLWFPMLCLILQNGVTICRADEMAPLKWQCVYPAPTASDLLDVCSAGHGIFYAVGKAGTILRLADGNWEIMNSGTSVNLNSVWAAAANDVYACGDEGTILHYDGDRWLPQFSGNQGDLSEIWGVNSQSVYTVGRRYRPTQRPDAPLVHGGVILHSNGTSWQLWEPANRFEQAISGNVQHIWGMSDNDFFFLNYNGSYSDYGTYIYHWDGLNCLEIGIAFEDTTALWGRDSSDMFIVDNPVLYHFDGVSLTSHATADVCTFGIWCATGTPITTVGCRIYTGDGSQWTEQPIAGGGTGLWFLSVTGEDELHQVAVGEQGRIAYTVGEEWHESFPRMETPEGTTGAWVFNPTNISAVTYNGQIFHYDGNNWNMAYDTDSVFWGIWGFSQDSLVAVGSEGAGTNGSVIQIINGQLTQLPSPSSNPLTTVWATSGNNIYVAQRYDCNGILWHYNGAGWDEVTLGSAEFEIGSIWGSGENDIYVSLWKGYAHQTSAMHYDGRDWERVDFGYLQDAQYIWGSSRTNVFVRGATTISHFDGMQWRPSPGPIGGPESGPAWALEPDRAYIASSKDVPGLIAYFDGQYWSSFARTAGDYIVAIGGTAADTTFAITQRGGIYRQAGIPDDLSLRLVLPNNGDYSSFVPTFNACEHVTLDLNLFSPAATEGFLWLALIAENRFFFWPSWGETPDNILVQIPANTPLAFNPVDLIWPYGAGRMVNAEFFSVLTSRDGNDVLGWDRKTFLSSSEYTQYSQSLSDCAGDWCDFHVACQSDCNLTAIYAAEDEQVFAVGQNGQIVHFDGVAWSAMNSPTSANLRDVWGASATDIIAVGEGGIAMRYDGLTWSVIDIGAGSDDLNGVSGTNSNDVFIVSSLESKYVYHFDGNTWMAMTLPFSAGLLWDVWGIPAGDVFFSTSHGVVHYDGSSWSYFILPNAGSNGCIWGSAPDNFYVGYHDDGTIYKFDGASWECVHQEPIQGINALSGSSSSNIYAVGTEGLFLHCDGVTWTQIQPCTNTDFNNVATAPDGKTFAVLADDRRVLQN